MKIRPASLDDLLNLYEIGKNTPQLRVSSTEEFMDLDEFRSAIEDQENVFLLAEYDNKAVGFIYANSRDKDKPYMNRYACLVYLVVVPKFRKKGVATSLYRECERVLKQRGINFLYGWANADSKEIIEFMKKQGFSQGHNHIWMDKKL